MRLKTAKGDLSSLQALKFPMAKNETIAMTATGDRLALVPCQRAVVTWRRAAVTAWLCLLAFFWFAGTNAFTQETASTNAPGKFANSDCLACHLDSNTTRVVNGKTESLVFPTNAFQKSVHAHVACVDCHTGIKD